MTQVYYLGIIDDRTGPQRVIRLPSIPWVVRAGLHTQAAGLNLSSLLLHTRGWFWMGVLDGGFGWSLLVPGEGVRHQSQVNIILFLKIFFYLFGRGRECTEA